MAATSLAAQLQALKPYTQSEVAKPSKRPFTKPSIIHDPKVAADIDLNSILSLALSGLTALIEKDSRYSAFAETLLSLKSRDVDRELLGIEENNKINDSISSFMRLLSGHLSLPSALNTLEYLIRRYKVHVYNVDELILCALPYHDTHVFVRIVQLLDFGNSKWGFLNGVKNSGAPPPRSVIVQQCIRDAGVFDTLREYASPMKKYRPSVQVVRFFTAVAIEMLGTLPVIESETVRRVLPFVSSGLEHTSKGDRELKAGALMLIGLLANRAALAPKPIKTLIESIARVAQQEATELTDYPWLHRLLMTMIIIIQSQTVQMLPKKALMILTEIRDFAGLLSSLSKEFNINKFLSVYLDSLVNYSSSEDFCRLALISSLGSLHLKSFIHAIVFKVLTSWLTLSKGIGDSKLRESGSWAKEILVNVGEKYPSELREALCKFLEDLKRKSKNRDSMFENLCIMLDGSLEISQAISDPVIWFSLDHPKAEVRRATLTNLATSGALKLKAVDSQKLGTIQETLLRRLHDNDLSVVQAALSMKDLPAIVDTPHLFRAFQDVLVRCVEIGMTSVTFVTPGSCEVAISCLDAILNLKDRFDYYSKDVATMIFPLLLVFAKTWKLNMKALELAREIQWPFHCNISRSYEMISSVQDKKLEPTFLTSINMKIIEVLAETFFTDPEESMPWLVDSCIDVVLSKTLLYMVVLQSLTTQNEDLGRFSALFQVCFPVLKKEWVEFESAGDILLGDEFNTEKLDRDCSKFLEHLMNSNFKTLNAELLICIFWRLLKTFVSMVPPNDSADNEKWLSTLDNLFVFFATSRLKNAFKDLLQLLIMKCSSTPSVFLSKFFTEEGASVSVQVESLLTYAAICSQSASMDKSLSCSHLQFLLGFPSVLVPLFSEKQEIRIAAMKCIEGLYALWHHIHNSTGKNGNGTLFPHSTWSPSLGDFLGLLVQQKRFILSDRIFLQSFLTAVLGSSCHDISVPQNIDQRFDQCTKEAIFLFILTSALKLSVFGKYMVLSLLRGMGIAIVHVEGANSLLSDLLERRNSYHLHNNESYKALSNMEVDTLCLLLECCAAPSATEVGDIFFDHFIMALRVNGLSSEDPAVVRPCVTVLPKLDTSLFTCLNTEMQDQLFRELVLLFRNDNGAIQNAAKEALLSITVTCSSVDKLLDLVIVQETSLTGLSSGRKKKKTVKQLRHELFDEKESRISFFGSLIDVILMKKDIENRASLSGSLFELLRSMFADEWLLKFADYDKNFLETMSGTICYIQQTVLLILEDISASLLSNNRQDDILNKFDVKLLVECARNTTDAKTRNHIFSLLSSISKLIPDMVLDHIIDIFTVIGQSAITQSDSHSRSVLEDLISTVVPFWLSSARNAQELLQIFINVLPEISETRRLTIMVYLLRTLGEKSSLASLLRLLISNLVSRTRNSWFDESLPNSESFDLTICKEWEYEFVGQVCAQYSCLTWLPSLVLLLEQVQTASIHQVQIAELLIMMHFVEQKLQDTEFVFKLASGEDSNEIQKGLGALMEQVVFHAQAADARSKLLIGPSSLKKELKDCMHRVLKIITKGMNPTSFFEGINLLLRHADRHIRKKALRFLCETINGLDTLKPLGKRKGQLNQNLRSFWVHLDESSLEAFSKMCSKIVRFVDGSFDDVDGPVKLAAVSALEVLANKFPSNNSMFASCLTSITKQIDSQNLDLSSSCLRAVGALINVLGPKALSELPQIMEKLLRRAHDNSGLARKLKSKDERSVIGSSGFKESFLLSVLFTLEAVVDKLGPFLNPYLGDIIELLVLHPEYVSGSDPKIKVKADTVRKLITEKIPVRLTLAPLLKSYTKTVHYGESSVAIDFEMLASIISAMDRSSIGSYHTKIFEHCLLALNIRHEHSVSVKHIDVVEQSVIHAMILLTMKLTETMFKPLFIRSLEWAESKLEGSGSTDSTGLDRSISFFVFVDKLVENHRSLFVPYFKYLLETCTRYLMDEGDAHPSSLLQKKKKAKIDEANKDVKEKNKALSPRQWHLKALIVSSLHKCFVYDTGSLKFLDQSNFQVLLKPLVSQLVIEPPPSLEELPGVPSVKEVDDSLVACLGQMAVTAGSDLLWKPLNHEVLMQTRNEKKRSRILGLRIVKYFVEHLKEEYLVLLAETIPFLGELLEDMEPDVKSLAQDILKEMETMSGESLQQYL